MKVEILGINGTWRDIANSANTTINKEAGDKEISSAWKTKILYSEHSPIRQLVVKWKWHDLKSWVSTHLVRHKYGIEHYVSTQRSDRTKVNRDSLTQDALVVHECHANAQAIINISKVRLCKQASIETRVAWQTFLDVLEVYEPELVSACVPTCIYRGFCPEFKSCRFDKNWDFYNKLYNYRGKLELYDKNQINKG